ncbi:VQ motif-containing protein [Forsythia ovata]|uniref:VQ motif-containing protein n=1 Tax=Forsythia ovata TaxID=205694 RepID=A0ABD1QEM4_9LAMI
MAGTEEIEEATNISRTNQSGEKFLQMKKSICALTHSTSINSTTPTSIHLSLQSPGSNIAQENLQYWVMEKQSCVPNSLAFSKEFTDNIESQEIIKTDAANFRVLVQRLTGKPTDSNCGKKKTKILFSNKPMAKQM